eukprot:scaffold168616_cov19-Tisochrysis_lutea.AAC.2
MLMTQAGTAGAACEARKHSLCKLTFVNCAHHDHKVLDAGKPASLCHEEKSAIIRSVNIVLTIITGPLMEQKQASLR